MDDRDRSVFVGRVEIVMISMALIFWVQSATSHHRYLTAGTLEQ
jgi:hypothetical protein